MIDVRVREDDRRDRRRLHWQLGPIANPQRLQTLEHAAVDEQAVPIGLEKVLRAGDGASGTQEGQRTH